MMVSSTFFLTMLATTFFFTCSAAALRLDATYRHRRLSSSSTFVLFGTAREQQPVREPRSERARILSNTITRFASIATATVTLASSLSSQGAFAVQGSIKASTLEESKAAAKQVKSALELAQSFDSAVAAKDWKTIAMALNSEPFSKFEEAATVLVRSDALSTEDKVSLGTIKRYGVVADAIIMIGGLGAELRAGGFQVNGGASTSSIEDAEDDDDEEEKGAIMLNESEVKKYVKLTQGSLNDVYKIVSPILSL